ncbi:MAG: hypothetical protein GX146_08030 [Myxococcales bacterium]|nr:hypothetical protein [Myxococcales bacterium]
MSPDISPEATQSTAQLKKRISLAMLLRLGIISSLLGATLFLNYQTRNTLSEPSARFLIVIVAFTYVFSIAYAIWLRIEWRMVWLARIQFAIDALTCGALAYATGGIGSGFTFLFHLWIIVTAIVLGGKNAYYSAAISAVVLVLLSLLSSWEIIPPLADLFVQPQTFSETLYHLGVNLLSLFLVAWLMTSLVHRLEDVHRGLAVAQATTADLQKLHSEVIRSMTNGLVIADEKGHVMDINPEGRNLLKIDAATPVFGQPISRWFPGLPLVFTAPVPHEERQRDAARGEDGEPFPIEHTLTALLDHDDTPKGFILNFKDLSRIQRLEEELEQTRRLAALGELAATFAHEVRNPLSVVSGTFQLLSTSTSPSLEDRHLLQMAEKETTRIERLLSDLLQYTRPKPPEKTRTNIAQAVRDVLTAFRLHQNDDVQITCTCSEDIYAELDPFQLNQILWNLLRNAVQAVSGNGAVSLAISHVNDHVRIVVGDNGPGVRPADRQRILEPFFSTRKQGMGLGLSICTRIVHAHGGTIEVGTSALGGAEFRLDFPIHSPR